MIHYRRQFGLFRHEIVLFSSTPPTFSLLSFAEHRASHFGSNALGFIRRKHFTLQINLEKHLEEILSEFDANTRNEIKRAQRDGVTYSVVDDLDDYIMFYNQFAEAKKLTTLKQSDLRYWVGHIAISQAMIDERPVVMHSYLIDESEGYVRLWQSASIFRSVSNSPARNAIGRANRFLHFKDVELFKRAGFKTYDFGGIAKNGNEEVIKIAKFKAGFGGIEVELTDYISISLLAALRCKALLRRFGLVRNSVPKSIGESG